MDAKEIIKRFKVWVKREKNIDLNLDPCEETILEYSLAGKAYSQISDHIPNYEFSTITNIKGPKLFQQLREVTGQQVNKKNCKLVLTQLIQTNNEQVNVVKINPLSHIDLNQAPDISDFYGRKKELGDLQKWIVTEQERCRLVAVLGISGIGKTVLVRELVENIQKHFDYVIWKNLEQSPCLEDILTNIERYFPCNHSETSIEQRISNLINYLNRHRCLLIFDQWEGVMANATTSEKQQKLNSTYERFLKRIGESEHQSCLVFTSLQRPVIMDLLVNRQRIEQLSLSGLENEDAKTLLQDLKLSDPGIEELIKRYQRHPLALILASATIKNIHNGQISKFLAGTLFISDVLIDLLDKQYSSLPNLEKNIIRKLATEPEPKLLTQIYQYFPLHSQAEVSQAIDKLWQIRLIEKEDIQEFQTLWVLNPLIKKYIIRRYNSII